MLKNIKQSLKLVKRVSVLTNFSDFNHKIVHVSETHGLEVANYANIFLKIRKNILFLPKITFWLNKHKNNIMNLYVRFFDQEVVVPNVEAALEFI